MKISSKGQKASKKGGKRRTSAQLPPTVSPADQKTQQKPKSGVKLPSPELAHLIEMANLGLAELEPQLIDRIDLRDTSGLLDAVVQLPDPPKSHLLELMHRPDSWPYWFELMGDDIDFASRQSLAVQNRYNLIRDARLTLESIVHGDWAFPATTIYLRRTQDNRAQPEGNQIAECLKGIDLADIRRCAVCNKFFFARRATSKVCDPESSCATTYDKRQERKNRKVREELAKRKKKRADPARKRH